MVERSNARFGARLIAGVLAFGIAALPSAIAPMPAEAHSGSTRIHDILIFPTANKAGAAADRLRHAGRRRSVRR